MQLLVHVRFGNSGENVLIAGGFVGRDSGSDEVLLVVFMNLLGDLTADYTDYADGERTEKK